MKLKEIDYKLLTYLYHNHNQPITRIAKATKITRDKVEYRIRKYTETGLIKKFFPVINYAKLGFRKIVIMFLKAEKTNQLQKLVNHLEKSKYLLSFGETLEKYDLYINALFKDHQEIEAFLEELLDNTKFSIKNYLIIEPTTMELYPLKFLKNFEKENYEIGNADNTIHLDKTDWNILSELAKDGRTNLLTLSNKTKTKTTTTLYRLKKLKKNKILLGNRVQFNTKEIGYNYTILLINYNQNIREINKKIKRFTKTSKRTNSLILNIHEPQAIIQFFYKEEQELRTAIQELKTKLKDETITIEIIHLEEEQYLNALPRRYQ